MLQEDLSFYSNKSHGNDSDASKAPIRMASKHIIPAESIVVNKELGVGEFGVVQQGVWTNEDGERIQVAIKCLSEQRMQNNPMEFLKEAAIMHSIDHEHIVRLYGVVLDSHALMLVTELAPLRSLLECLKEPALKSSFTILSLCDFAVQICDGMAYLESKRLIHRDLAARNILVFAKNKVKISDFGLSRALGVGKDYYQTNFNVNLKLPIAWCAAECINYLKFTSASDVWAFGVTLWEMFSYGFQPWAALTGQQILEAIDEPCFQRLEQPECCPKEYYSIMQRCWEHEPNKRPKFSEIIKVLPDCRPELVQVVKEMPELSIQPLSMSSSISETNSSSKMCKKQYLQCKVGDIITVLDKKPHLSSSSSSTSSIGGINSSIDDTAPLNLWKGALNNGKTGLFNPNFTVAYLGQNLPTSTNTGTTSTSNSFSYSTAFISFIRGILDNKGLIHSNSNIRDSIYSSKRRLRPEMISKPQGDFKHTGHVGADGAFFGDISFLGDKYHQLPKHLGGTLKPSMDDKLDRASIGRHSSDLSDRTPLISKYNNSSSLDEKNCPSQRNDKGSDRNKSTNKTIKNGTANNVNEHEYHEINNEDDFGSLESPHFETLDFGPSLMDEVFKELDLIKPELSDELAEQQKAINDCNVKNEIKEIAIKLASNKDTKKKPVTMKPISPAEEQNLDSAIAMAKELATRSMLEFDFKPVADLKNFPDNGPGLSDSPKTPSSPSKKNKFSFKFKTLQKSEPRSYSDETGNISDIQSILTEDAKRAYNSLVEKGEGLDKTRSSFVEKNGCLDDSRRHTLGSTAAVNSYLPASCHTSNLTEPESLTGDSNPLRLLRSGAPIIPKVKGNKQRIAATPQTASLARLTANVTRANLGSPPPVPVSPALISSSSPSLSSSLPTSTVASNDDLSTQNALPLPPRDRSKIHHPILKQHQRKHPLIIPACANNQISSSESNGSSINTATDSMSSGEPLMSTFKPHLPALKQVYCPDPSPNYINSVVRKTSESDDKCSSPISVVPLSPKKMSVMAPPPPKPTRTFAEDKVDSSREKPSSEAYPILLPNTTTNSALSTDVDNSKNKTTLVDNLTTHHVSCEDLMNFATDKPTLKPEKIKGLDSDEVRVMMKILGIDVTAQECWDMLNVTEWDTLRAIKCIKLGRSLKTHSIDISCARLAETLTKFNGNRHQASNYLIATHGLPEDTTEV